MNYDNYHDVKIESCPLCGGFAKLERKSKTFIKGEEKRVTYVRCVHCDCRGPRVLIGADVGYAREQAVAMWNRRV